MFRRTLVWITVGLLAFALWGCSSSRDSDGSKTGTDEGPEYVGINVCVSCHDIKGQEWLYSRHGNSEPDGSPHSPHLPGESSCADCHNPLNDGDLVQQAFNTHEKRRDVVGCETCHGAGGQHYGLGPLPIPAPGPDVCGQCHNRDDGHAGTDKSIFDKYSASKHTESLHGEGSNPCQRCHTHEGALKANVAGYTGDKDVLGTRDDLGRRAPTPVPEEEVTPVGCPTCHDPHEVGQLRQVWSSERDNDYMWDPNNNGSNRDQFDLCTSCHVLFNDEGTLVGSGTVESGTAPFYHDTAWFRIIGTTHYDQPTDTDACNSRAFSQIEGYNIRWESENPCFDCHGHEFRTNTRPRPEGDDRDAPTIWTDWAGSAHAGHLFRVKLDAAAQFTSPPGGDPSDAPRGTDVVDAVMFAGATDETGEGWTHYNWDHPGRASCQRCHTATGAMNFMNDPESYDPSANEFSHLLGWGVDDCGSPQNEMLYCWACHTNAGDGDLRNPGPITEEYDPDVIVDYPDIDGSNVCMTCHLGRETGEVVKTKTGFDNLRFVNSHYLAAGGTVFAVTGYTYEPRDYGIPGSDVHDDLGRGTTGVPAIDDNYLNGPCVTCHFSSNDGSHTISPFTQYAADDLALNPVCVNCHTSRGEGTNAAHDWLGTDFTLNDLVAGEVAPHKGRYLAALETLRLQLADNGYVFTPNYPYFSNTDWTVGVSSNGMHNMGAAFNYNLLIHDPGGVAHNRRYTRRLIYDSIDHMDDGLLNYSVAATLNALDDAATYKASAISFLLKEQNGDAGDRY